MQVKEPVHLKINIPSSLLVIIVKCWKLRFWDIIDYHSAPLTAIFICSTKTELESAFLHSKCHLLCAKENKYTIIFPTMIVKDASELTVMYKCLEQFKVGMQRK